MPLPARYGFGRATAAVSGVGVIVAVGASVAVKVMLRVAVSVAETVGVALGAGVYVSVKEGSGAAGVASPLASRGPSPPAITRSNAMQIEFLTETSCYRNPFPLGLFLAWYG